MRPAARTGSAPLKPDSCPCGRPHPYAKCCGVHHAGKPAADAASLMRSRYSAFVLQREDYLLATWHPSTRPAGLNLSVAPQPKWLGLQVKAHTETDNTASVEFIARYRVGGRAQRLHEVSRFVHEEGCWYYLSGLVKA